MHKITPPDWARARAGHRFAALDPQRTALINIDLQRAFMAPGLVFGKPHALDIAPNINRLSAAMRARDGKVAWTRQTYTDEPPFAPPEWHYDASNPHVARAMAALRKGAPGHALHELMAVEGSDAVLDKYRYSALLCPAGQLERWLKATAADTLIITGTLTNCCCESTARDAHMMGYRVFFVSDATAGVTDEEHNAALLNLMLMFADIRRTAEMLALISA